MCREHRRILLLEEFGIDPAKVRAGLDKHGLVCGSVCACMGPGRDFRGTPEEQATAMTYCKTLIDQMVVLGCPSLIGPIYSVVGKADAVEPAQQKVEWGLVVKNMKELAAYAESKGVQLCVEPLNRFETDFLNTCDQGLKLIKAIGSKAVKLHLDTFHMNIEESDIGAVIRRAGPLVGHVHFADSNRAAIGYGHTEVGPVVEALKDHYRVVRFDMTSHGLTGPDPTGDYTLPRTLKSAEKALRARSTAASGERLAIVAKPARFGSARVCTESKRPAWSNSTLTAPPSTGTPLTT